MKKKPTFFDITSLQKLVCIKSVGFFFQKISISQQCENQYPWVMNLCVKCNCLSMNFPQTYNERGR